MITLAEAEINKELPEDRIDPDGVHHLDQLEKLAKSNSDFIRGLQRLQVEVQGQTTDPGKTTERLSRINDALHVRLQRNSRLRKRRDRLKKWQQEQKLQELENLLNPDITTLNNEKRRLVGELTQLYEHMKHLRVQVPNLEQRKLSSCLYLWDQKILAAISELDKLPNLTRPIEVD